MRIIPQKINRQKDYRICKDILHYPALLCNSKRHLVPGLTMLQQANDIRLDGS